MTVYTERSSGKGIRLHTRLESLLKAVTCFASAFSVAGISVLGECAPLAVAFVGACGAELNGVLALIGTAFGYWMFYGIGIGIQYIAAGVMVYTAAFVCRYLPIYQRRGFMPMIVIVMVGLVVAFGTVSTVRADLPFWIRIGFDVFSSGLFTYLYGDPPSLMEKPMMDWDGREYLSATALGISLLSVLAVRLEFDGISIGRILGGLCVMVVTYCGGILGCGMGTAVGVVMDMISGDSYRYTFCYALSALLSGQVRRKGKFLFAVAYALSAVGTAVINGDMESTRLLLFEMLIGFAIFLLIPGRQLRKGTAVLETAPAGAGDIRKWHYEARKIRKMAETFGVLRNLLSEEEMLPSDDVDAQFDRATEVVCTGCGKKGACWTNHYMDMLVILGEAVPAMHRRGRLQASDLPGYFCDYCPKSNELILAINYELRRCADQRMREMERKELVSAGAAQYGEFSALLEAVSEGMLAEYGAEARCEQRINRYLRALELECDASAFRDSAGRLRITISGRQLPQLLARKGYLDELSEALNMRLCRPAGAVKRSLLLLEAEPYAVNVGVAARKKRGEAVSGDRGRYFKTDSGILYVILSDGLGTGDDAAEQSSMVVDMLERFLRSGISPLSSVKLLNSAMMLKNPRAWGYATVDLLSVDLFSGEALFIKYGAAPSYVLTAQGLQTVSCDSFSAGVWEENLPQPNVQAMQLQDGDVVIVASDGLTIGSEQKLLRIMQKERDSMKSMARRILLSAGEADLFGDDMTVLAIGLETRK